MSAINGGAEHRQSVDSLRTEVPAFVTLVEAAKQAPGRPSACAMWRWCRKGVLARSGAKIRLRHVRLGGRVFTTAAWIEQFGHALATADAAHFDSRADATTSVAAKASACGAPGRRAKRILASTPCDRQRLDEVESELEAEGL